MIYDGKDITGPQKAQVCVVGSGPAAVTAAWELSKSGLDVLLLDGGRRLDYSRPGYYQKSWPDKVLLYNGTADGNFSKNEGDFLIRPYDGATTTPRERERVYGGTSTHWGGQSRPLDPITFEKRPGFPGWPISREKLDPYYAKAAQLNNLYGDYGTDGTNFTAEFWEGVLQNAHIPAAVPQLTGFTAEMYQFMGRKWLNFAIRPFEEKPIGDHIRVIVNATLLNIVEQGGSVRTLQVASMNDDPENPQKKTEFTVTADLYILACGAVANARQLLLSQVGNNLVGHYFMCHPLTQIDVITAKNYLTPEESSLMNGGNNRWRDPSNNIAGFTGRFSADANTARDNGIGQCWFWPGTSGSMYFEMAPNFDSYVELDNSTDPEPVFGQQQTRIHWVFSDQDRKTYEKNCELFKNASSRVPDIITWEPWDSIAAQWIVNGHHIGTTRMSAASAPTEGVVDENLKVHGVDNLYVAGSSVFPTAGISNPTMTIITLSIRLAEHMLLRVIKPKARSAGQ
jgi:choline dehydrogenase-like flavoprotein